MQLFFSKRTCPESGSDRYTREVSVVVHALRAFGQYWHGLRWATELGYVPDTGVMDWRDAVPRLRTTTVRKNLLPLLDAVPPGHLVYLIRAIVAREIEWRAPWTHLVKVRSAQWIHHMQRDPRFKLIHISNAFLGVSHRNGAVQGRLYLKIHR